MREEDARDGDKGRVRGGQEWGMGIREEYQGNRYWGGLGIGEEDKDGMRLETKRVRECGWGYIRRLGW